MNSILYTYIYQYLQLLKNNYFNRIHKQNNPQLK